MDLGYEIVIEVDPAYVDSVDVTALEQVARRVLAAEGVAAPADLSVWITDADQLHILNKTYRNVDRSTDVLSFGEADDDQEVAFVEAPDAPDHIGDVAISYDHVREQAIEYGHTPAREVAYLLVHGILHLLGYDHEAADDAVVMRAHEEQHLGALGITRDAATQ